MELRRQRTYGITDEQAFGVGLPCGGEIDVYVARADAELLRSVVEEIARGRVVTVEPSGDGLAVASRPAPRLIVVGAIDTAEALCRGAKSLGWAAIVVDPRERWATAERVPSADEIVVEWPDAALARLGPDEGTAVVVLAHEDRIDLPALQLALASDAFFIGAIGSRRTQERRRDALLELGVDEEAVDQDPRPGRARRRRRVARRDGGRDPRRDPRGTRWARRRPAPQAHRPHPRVARLSRRRAASRPGGEQ